MKTRILAIVSLMVVSLLCLAACYAVPGEVLVEITRDEFTEHNAIVKKQVIALHGILVVGLWHNPDEGYEWDWTATEPGIVELDDHHYESVEDNTDADGIDVWSFTAVKRGNTTITMEQTRTGVPDEKGPWTLTITVSVR